VDAVDEERARLNCIGRLLSEFQYYEILRDPVHLPARVRNPEDMRTNAT
jgi:hypothetical protein